jgi:hypothetical protein
MSIHHDSHRSPLADTFLSAGMGYVLSDLIIGGVETIARQIRRFRARQAERSLQRETERIVSELSPEMRHDIGWPGRYEQQKLRWDHWH